MTVTKMILRPRHHGIHSPIKSLILPHPPGRYWDAERERVFEQNILDDIPKGWLPVAPKYILIIISVGRSSTGQRELEIFRPWAKYFDAYCLEIELDAEATP